MANLYPSELNIDTIPTGVDIIVVQKNGETEVKQATITNLIGNNGTAIKTAYEAEANTNAYADADALKVGFISVTQAVNLDTIESDSLASKTITDFITVTQAVNLNTSADVSVNRPAVPVIGMLFFDTTLDAINGGKPIWYNGTNWVDATAAIV